jgi:2-polyprenyl-3-methyl-5-hydroxy-6-metoxy-1,4-benzoquinol methylase
MDTSALHRNLYDALAEEYERRADSLLPVTEDAMDYFSSHIKPGGLILDIGCGVGIAMNVLARKGFQVVGMEISPKMAEFAKRRNPGARVMVGDFMETEFDETFDAILAFAFIHLFPKAEVPAVFDKMKSVLHPGGVCLISTTESSESREGMYVKEDFGKEYRRFRKYWTEEELRESLIASGFEILDLKKYADPFGKVWMDFVVRV